MARCLIEPLSQGGEPGAHVIPPKESGCVPTPGGDHDSCLASQVETLEFEVSVAFCGTQRCRPSGRTTRYPANAPNQPARADFKRLTEQRMDGVDDPDSG